MRLFPLLLLGVAGVALTVVLVGGALALQPNRQLLNTVSISPEQITPNADGNADVAAITYTLSRNATVSIVFTNTQTQTTYKFRDAVKRPAGTFSVLFSGVVDGYVAQNEDLGGTVETRLMPNGNYRWVLTAIGDSGETAMATGTIQLADGDSAFPALMNVEVTPKVFSPNQDGYDDRMTINLYLAKPSEATLYLTAPGQGPYYIAQRDLGRSPVAGASVRQYDYDAGVDNNVTPPPDGDYTLVIIAQDKVGQRVRHEERITIKDGGLPNAEIVAQAAGRTVTWASRPYEDRFFTDSARIGALVEQPADVTSTLSSITLPQSDLLVFSLVISNYGSTPIRTYGPFPGTVYQDTQTDSAMVTPDARNAYSGAWRLGVQCERSEQSYPWRWAIGTLDQLTKVERNGETLYYLMPGQKATTWGAIRMTTLYRTRNPQKCWVGLIHQDVQIPFRQNNVGTIDVELKALPQ
jgi:hypothetical protein